MSDTPPFDPGEHTVTEVVEHLDANPDDRDRVIEAESVGKARKGVLESGGPANITTDNLGRVVTDGRDFLGRDVG